MITDYLEPYRVREDYTDEEILALHDYFYQLFLRCDNERGTSEYALMNLFKDDMSPHLAIQDKLQELKIPISFIIGDNDWVKQHIGSAGKEIAGDEGCWECPDGGHNMQLDNMRAVSNIILRILIKDLEEEKYPILNLQKY